MDYKNADPHQQRDTAQGEETIRRNGGVGRDVVHSRVDHGFLPFGASALIGLLPFALCRALKRKAIA
jgi:hypothetical protein